MSELAEELANKAIERGSRDNITVIAVDLKHFLNFSLDIDMDLDEEDTQFEAKAPKHTHKKFEF